METELIAEEYSLTWKGHIQHVQDSFAKLLQNNQLCDVTLYAEGQKIGAHKVFLIACSDYFNQLFQDLKDERPVIVLKGVKFDVLQQILRFIYIGQISIEIEKLNDFLEAAEFLKICGLINENVLKKRTPSLFSEADNASNTGDEKSCISNSVVKRPEEQTTGVSATDYRDNHFLKKTNSEISSYVNPKVPMESESTNKKYTLDSPERGNEWISDYEHNSQSLLGDCSQCPSILKRRRIKSERFNHSVEEIKEVKEFVNNDITDEADSLEKSMLKTSSATINDQCNQDSLKKHFAFHAKNTTCQICGITISRKALLRRHMKLHMISAEGQIN